MFGQQPSQEQIVLRGIAARNDLDIATVVAHRSADAEFMRQQADEWPEADTLDAAADQPALRAPG